MTEQSALDLHGLPGDGLHRSIEVAFNERDIVAVLGDLEDDGLALNREERQTAIIADTRSTLDNYRLWNTTREVRCLPVIRSR